MTTQPTHATAPLAPGEQAIDAEVTVLTSVARSVRAIELRPASGEPLPAWAPGAHIDLVLPNGLLRQYSLCGDPADSSSYRVAVLREKDGKGGSAYVHDELAVGDRLEIRGPRNNFDLEDADSYRFVAGGIGITPILPMIAEVHRRGADWSLVYLGRDEQEIAFRDEIADTYPADRVTFAVTAAGRPTIEEILGPPGSAIYACGPTGLLAAIQEHSAGLPDGSVRLEHFEPDRAAIEAPADGFEVYLTQDGRTLAVPPEKSILDVVEGAGIAWPYSCREGTCGTCETRIVAGAADHRDAILSPAEKESNEYMMICVSRAEGDRIELEI